MSFVEKNKAWLLPLLAVGVGGVVYLNFGTSSSTPKPATPDPPAQASAPPPVAAPTAAPATPTAGAPTSDLWSDLKAQALVPGPLGQDEDLEVRARQPLNIESPTAPDSVARPAWIRDPQPRSHPESAASTPAPEVDFLVTSPSGSQAWFDGHGYKPGETLNGTPFRVGPIAPSSVDLSGPGGSTRRWTNPLHRSGPKAPSPETP